MIPKGNYKKSWKDLLELYLTAILITVGIAVVVYLITSLSK